MRRSRRGGVRRRRRGEDAKPAECAGAGAARGVLERPAMSELVLVTARSRLVHFFVVGGIIFALAPRVPSWRDLTISSRTLGVLRAAQARRLGAAQLTPAQSDEVTARAVEDELLYREGLRLGLDHNDNIVRQRLIEKVLFIAEQAGSKPPTEDELRDYYKDHIDDYRLPPAVAFEQLFVNPERRDQLAALRERLDARTDGELPAFGDPPPGPRQMGLTPIERLARDYGPQFADAVAALPAGEWSAPIQSRYGFHLVKVVERRAGDAAPFAAVRERVRGDLVEKRRKEATRAYLKEAAARYHIEVAGRRVSDVDAVRPSTANAPVGD